eukprot:6911316-Prymnesium_polylepis.1
MSASPPTVETGSDCRSRRRSLAHVGAHGQSSSDLPVKADVHSSVGGHAHRYFCPYPLDSRAQDVIIQHVACHVPRINPSTLPFCCGFSQ